MYSDLDTSLDLALLESDLEIDCDYVEPMQDFTAAPSSKKRKREEGNDDTSSAVSALKDSLRDKFICPITQELMVYPVALSCGHSFEYSAIEKLRVSAVRRGARSGTVPCPSCRQAISIVQLRTVALNSSLRDVIATLFEREIATLLQNDKDRIFVDPRDRNRTKSTIMSAIEMQQYAKEQSQNKAAEWLVKFERAIRKHAAKGRTQTSPKHKLSYDDNDEIIQDPDSFDDISVKKLMVLLSANDALSSIVLPKLKALGYVVELKFKKSSKTKEQYLRNYVVRWK